jgi:hypothetical protein
VRYAKDMIHALWRDLIRKRGEIAVIYTALFFVALYLALNWPVSYISQATIIRELSAADGPNSQTAGSAIDSGDSVNGLFLSRRLIRNLLTRVSPELLHAPPEKLELAITAFSRDFRAAADNLNPNIFHLSYSSPSADQSYVAVKTLLDIFVEERSSEQQKIMDQVQNLQNDQVGRGQKELAEAEEKLRSFQSKNDDFNEQPIKGRVAELKAEIQKLNVAIQESVAKVTQFELQLNTKNQAASLNPELRSLSDRRQALLSQLDELRLVYQESYPDIVTIKSQIFEIDQLIDTYQGTSTATNDAVEGSTLDELRKQASLAGVELQNRKRRHASLQDALQKEQDMLVKASVVQKEYEGLVRDYETKKKVYEELQAQVATDTANVVDAKLNKESYAVIEPPTYPLRPVGVARETIFWSAPVLALGLPIGLLAVFSLFDRRLRSLVSLSHALPAGVQLLGVVPYRGNSADTRVLRYDGVCLVLLASVLALGYVYIFFKYRALLFV